MCVCSQRDITDQMPADTTWPGATPPTSDFEVALSLRPLYKFWLIDWLNLTTPFVMLKREAFYFVSRYATHYEEVKPRWDTAEPTEIADCINR